MARAVIAVTQGPDRGHADVEYAVLPADLLANPVHLLAGAPHLLQVADAPGSVIGDPLQISHHLGCER